MRLALAALALLALAGCAADDAGPASGPAATTTNAAAAPPSGAATTGTEAPRMAPLHCEAPPESQGRNGTLVLREREEFEPWFQSHCAWSGDAAPDIDFNASMVVAYFWGEKPSGGYQAVVSGYVPEGAVGSVRVTRITPGPSCVTAAVLTYPMAAAIVSPKREQVDFVFKDVVNECG